MMKSELPDEKIRRINRINGAVNKFDSRRIIMQQEFNSITKVEGELEFPGDKSISHRAVMFSALAEGTSKIFNISNGEDVSSTQKCFRGLGVTC